jgi:type I restriction enzyme M protein
LARRTKNNHPQDMVPANQSIFTSPDEHLDISMLETWLWDAACAIRGSTDAPKFKELHPATGLL